MNKTGVLLINTGSPKSTGICKTAAYLFRFLTDKRVINVNAFLRYFLVCFIIIPLRVFKVTKRYRLIFKNGFPLINKTIELSNKLNLLLGENYDVKYAMRYSTPFINDSIKQFCSGEYSNLIVIPMFPHYSSAMTGSVIEEVNNSINKNEFIPELVILNGFFESDFFIDSIIDHVKNVDIKNFDHTIFVYHSLPLSQTKYKNNTNNVYKYEYAVNKTSELVAERLNIKNYDVCYQSAIGKKWLGPDIEETVKNLKNKGKSNILCFPLSFVTSCLENTYELDIEYKQKFQDIGVNLTIISSLDTSEIWCNNLAKKLREL